MSETIYEPKPRYEVQLGEASYLEEFDASNGTYVKTCTTTYWNFDAAFNQKKDAISYADRLAEDNEYVRVIDREGKE